MYKNWPMFLIKYFSDCLKLAFDVIKKYLEIISSTFKPYLFYEYVHVARYFKIIGRLVYVQRQIDESDWSGPEAMGKLKEIREKRGYTYQDVCAISKESLGEAYDDKINMFYKEHLHTDEEIRLIEEGA